MIGRIVVVNDLARPQGGASKLALESATAFAGRGHRVTVLSGDRGPDEPDPKIEYAFLGQDRLLGGSVAGSAIRGIYNAGTTRLVCEWIARNDTPDTVYHVHGWSQILSPSLFGALAPVRERMVVTAHDFFLTCPNGAIYDYVAERICERRPMSLGCLTARCDRRHHAHKLWRSARHIVQDRLLRSGPPPPVLLIHAGMGPYFERSGLGPRDMAVLPDPVTPYCETRIPAERNRDVLFVGRLEATKGIDLAAEACRRAGARLVAVGDGAMLAELREKYPEMRFPGRMQPQDIGGVAREARMLVMPSRHMEPFGLSAVEALWSGLPVICSRDSLIAQDIEQSGAGLSVDPRDTAAFAAAIAALLADDALTGRMSHAAFSQTGHLAFTPESWIDALLDFYATLLERGTAAAVRAARERADRRSRGTATIAAEA